MPKCAASGCNNSSDLYVKMSVFPKDSRSREKWIKNCDLVQLPKNPLLCEVNKSANCQLLKN